MPGLAKLAAVFLMAAAFPLWAPPVQGPDSPRDQTPIRVTVQRVNVGVVVTDLNGHFVGQLKREDFHVLDDGIEQPLANFSTVEEPAQVLLLIEAGPAVYLLEESHLRAAYTFLNGLAAGDSIALVKYSEAPQPILDFTTDKQAALQGLDQLQFNLGFGSLNLSSSLDKVLQWIATATGKKTVILLSTGVDTSAPGESVRLLRRLSSGDVRTFAVSLAAGLQAAPAGKKNQTRQPPPDPHGKLFEEAGQLLKQIAAVSGGRAYFPQSLQEFEGVYAEIAQLVRHEYSLAIIPQVQDGKFHAVSVRVGQPGAGTGKDGYRVSHRQGYLAPAARRP